MVYFLYSFSLSYSKTEVTEADILPYSKGFNGSPELSSWNKSAI